MALNRNDYKLVTNADYQNIIGRNLDKELANEEQNHSSDYMIVYASILIDTYISKYSGRHLFKVANPNNIDGFDIKFGYTEKTAFTLNKKQKENLQLAIIYQIDYMIDNGSPERMSGLSISSRTAILNKEDLVSYEICDISYQLLMNSGLLYSGIGGGTNAWFK